MKTVIDDIKSQSHSDWRSQHGSESATLEAAGYEWRRAFWVVKARVMTIVL